jgi:hypothetical protein
MDEPERLYRNATELVRQGLPFYRDGNRREHPCAEAVAVGPGGNERTGQQ